MSDREFLQCAVEAARVAGRYLYEQFDQEIEYDLKADHQDLVTASDRKSEEIIFKIIRDRYPTHRILSEESPPIETDSEYRWVVDPIDGTTNFAHKIPLFCVSIGLEKNDELIAGVLYDPMRDELFSAARGTGAYLNNTKISVSSASTLKRSVVMAGFPYKEKALDDYMQMFRSTSQQCQGLRRLGSAALALAYVAAGRIDGFWTLNINYWDVAAGLMLIEEAGGVITNLAGGERSSSDRELLTSNRHIHQELIEMLEV